MYQALYRKYRPQTFDDVSGQLAVTQTLRSQITSGHLSHAYLFTGTRGTGKTSCAKILAKAVNCLNPDRGNPCNLCASCKAIDSGACMDVLEIDAASNNGVDNVRDLRDAAVYSPSEVRKRVYIIDEVHMLSLSAFNALLKLIEEPPEHLMFILATTELHKVPATILSRCQRFGFKRLNQEDIKARLQYVSFQENIELDDSAAGIIARLADGGMRDALSLLDQCASASEGELTAEAVYNCLGIAGERACAELFGKIVLQDTTAVLELFNRLYAEGKDLAALLDELACLIRDILVIKTAGGAGIAMLSGVAEDKEVLELASKVSEGELVRMMSRIQETSAGFRNNSNRRRDAELCLLELCRPELSLDAQSLNARLSKLEDQIRSGAFVQNPSAQQADGPLQSQNNQNAAPLQSVSPEETLRMKDESPPGFWAELSQRLRQQLKPPLSGFFMTGDKSPVHGMILKNQLVLICRVPFTFELVHRDDVLSCVERVASSQLGHPIRAVAVNASAGAADASGIQHLLKFSEDHGEVIHIK